MSAARGHGVSGVGHPDHLEWNAFSRKREDARDVVVPELLSNPNGNARGGIGELAVEDDRAGQPDQRANASIMAQRRMKGRRRVMDMRPRELNCGETRS